MKMKTKMKKLFEDVTFTQGDESVDQQIDELIYRAERLAVQAGTRDAALEMEESLSRASMRLMLEDDEKNEKPPISVETFASEIISAIMMYKKVMDIPDIIDIPGVIVSRARSFLQMKYGDDIAEAFDEILKKDVEASRFIKSPNVDAPAGPVEQPLAVGATGGGGGAA